LVSVESGGGRAQTYKKLVDQLAEATAAPQGLKLSFMKLVKPWLEIGRGEGGRQRGVAGRSVSCAGQVFLGALDMSKTFADADADLAVTGLL
jgi:hypothetical protein